jgi:spectinomycin phosphotransferase
LPLGADRHTAVYHLIDGNGTAYFVQLRSGRFDKLSVTLPRFLYDQGIKVIIPPLPTYTGQLWAILCCFTLLLYPFVEGRDGYVNEAGANWESG